MADYNAQQATFEAEYQKMYPFQLTQEFHQIRANHTKENMMDDLVKMAALMKVMKERNVPVPDEGNGNRTGNAQQNARPQVNTQLGSNSSTSYDEGGANWGKVVLGTVIFLVGMGLTFGGSGGIFYGAILVGIFMIIGGLMGG